MFEDSFFPRRPGGRARAARLIPLGLSLVLHGFLVYGIYHTRFLIKMLPTRTTVRDIRIVPPLKPTLPRIVGPLRPGPAEGRLIEEGTSEAGTGGGARPPAAEPAPQAAPSAPSPSPSPAGPIIAALSADFQKSLSSRLKSRGESELKVVLSPPGAKAGPGPAVQRPPDFYKYIPGSVARAAAGTGAGRGTAGAGGAQRAGISIPLKGYDLGPWAQKVLEIIVKNWDLPWAGNLRARTAVKIVLMIKKDGEVMSIELVEGTALDTLDEAALTAIRASLPLPALPDDFPGDILEAAIEFVYHD